MKTKLFFTIILSCLVIFATAQIIHIPAVQPTIQAGIDAATTGDTVLVETGTYYENIRFNGKAITVASNYIIDGDTSNILYTIINGSQPTDPDSASVVMFLNYEDTTSTLNGFTITGGSGVLSTLSNIKRGGGIFCNNAGAKIINNRITENHVNHGNKAAGAGIGCQRDSGDHCIIIRNNTINYNSTTTSGGSAYGAGIYASINTIIKNNVIEYNHCENTAFGHAEGGAIEIEQYPNYNIDTEITNNVIRHNSLIGYECLGAGVVVLKAKAYIAENTIKINTSVAGNNCNGGGILIDSPLEDVKLLNNDISENTINAGNYGRGGGVCFWNPRDKLTMVKNKINNNITDAEECRGTGVLFRCNQYPTGKIEVRQNEFIGNLGNMNAANCNGGGVCLNNAWDTLVIFDGNRFEGNSAIRGGGIYSKRSYNIKLTNNLFIDNTASNVGGGLRLYQPVSDNCNFYPQIINNTFYNNSSDYGGAIGLYCETSVSMIFNNIFWENQSPNYNDIYYDDSGTDSIFISYNNIDPDEIYGQWTGIGNIFADPLFADPENGDYHLSWANFPIPDETKSPCIDAGDPNSPLDPDSTIADMGALYFNQSQLTQEISLSPGFQFVSSHLYPAVPDMEVVVAEIVNDNLLYVRNSEGAMLRKIGPNWVNGIGDWIGTEGYLIKYNGTGQFTISGELIPATTAIDVTAGFQFVSYLPTVEIDASEAFASILGDDLIYVRNSAGNMLRKIGPNWVNGIGNCIPNEGYLVKMAADAVLVYPEGGKLANIIRVKPVHFQFEGGNASENVYTIYIAGLEIGDEVAAFDGDVMTGAMRINSKNTFDNELAVFSSVFSGQGYQSGNPVVLKIFNNSTQSIVETEYTLENVFEEAYMQKYYPSEDGLFSVINITKSSERLIEETLSVYPNPASDLLNINSNNQILNVKILNYTGQIVADNNFNNKEVIINTSVFNSGIYFIQIETVKGISTKKVVIE